MAGQLSNDGINGSICDRRVRASHVWINRGNRWGGDEIQTPVGLGGPRPRDFDFSFPARQAKGDRGLVRPYRPAQTSRLWLPFFHLIFILLGYTSLRCGVHRGQSRPARPGMAPPAPFFLFFSFCRVVSACRFSLGPCPASALPRRASKHFVLGKGKRKRTQTIR